MYRYEAGYFKFIGEEQAAVREFQMLIEARDIAGLYSKCGRLLCAFMQLESKAGHHGPPLIMDYYPGYELYVRELYHRKTSGGK